MAGESGQNCTTRTDPSTQASWGIDDPVIRLREWGSDRVHNLPDTPVEIMLGAAPGCGIQLHDPMAQTSRQHAKLVPCGGGWEIADEKSKNGLWRDGARRLQFRLTPGVEIGIGSLRLIAESRQLMRLRALVSRFLGWSAWRQADVDEALRSLRDWAARRVSLVLMGDGDLFTVARQLHRATLARGAPFVACDEQRDGMTALGSAAHGTLWVSELPPDFVDVAASLREVGCRTRLMLHAQSAEDAARVAITLARPAIIKVPSFTSRHAEMRRLLLECADDAAERFGVTAPILTRSDLRALAALHYKGFAGLEATLSRVVALRKWGLTAASERIGITHVALLRWARRRNLET